MECQTILEDPSRYSWEGTAHEVREIVATLLRTLAPDAEATAKSWFKQEPNTAGPTQRQRARFFLDQHSAGSKQRIVDEMPVLDAMVAEH